MTTPSLCTFAGYVSEAGGKLVQDWYESLPREEHEELLDILNYLSNMPMTSWRRPEFDKVTPPLHEIRCKANKKNHIIRVYGVFDAKVRGRFVMLHGNECKKTGNDQAGQDLALQRYSLLKQGRATTHEFAF
jgi:phage-related protein